jgi:hypothetical protein
MHRPRETVLLLAVIVLACGAAGSERTAPPDSTKPKAADKQEAAGKRAQTR